MNAFDLDITAFKHADWGGDAGNADIIISAADWSDARFKMHVRPSRGNTGTPLISLINAAAGSQGISASYAASLVHPKTRDLLGGTIIRPQIDKATLEALAYADDPADDRVLFYDLHITLPGAPRRVLCGGRFTVKPGVTV